MSASIPSRLSPCGEEVVRKIFKTVRATKYEDPVDQDSFLMGSANAVLKFRSQVDSFALVPELAECVFTIRSMMHSNSTRLGTPFHETFILVQDFAGEIVRKRQLFRDRKRANENRLRAAEGAAARMERRAALEKAAHLNSAVPHSPGEDVVSIPSGDESGGDEPPPIPHNPPASPITVDLTNNPVIKQVRLAAYLSPLADLDARLARLSLSALPCSPPRSPSSPNLSLPDLVPDFTLVQCKLPVKGGGWNRGRTMLRHHRNAATPAPVVQCNSVRLVRLPFGPPLPSQRSSYVADRLQSKPKSADSRVLRKKYLGDSNHSANPNHHARRIRRDRKRCFYCASSDHLVALCPMRECID
ncbi:hypothetical protein K438DRAFT_1965145 [Mycena galopus ATCC 62051]|nr:hypothetical protein K438DRAFT_1965145 [Mycena galopus ATCC 62051]